MTKLIEIEDYKGLVRDMHSKAVLNIDIQAKKEHKRSKDFLKNLMEDSKKIEDLESSIDEIKNDINEIKNMFIQLIQNKV